MRLSPALGRTQVERTQRGVPRCVVAAFIGDPPAAGGPAAQGVSPRTATWCDDRASGSAGNGSPRPAAGANRTAQPAEWRSYFPPRVSRAHRRMSRASSMPVIGIEPSTKVATTLSPCRKPTFWLVRKRFGLNPFSNLSGGIASQRHPLPRPPLSMSPNPEPDAPHTEARLAASNAMAAAVSVLIAGALLLAVFAARGHHGLGTFGERNAQGVAAAALERRQPPRQVAPPATPVRGRSRFGLRR